MSRPSPTICSVMGELGVSKPHLCFAAGSLVRPHQAREPEETARPQEEKAMLPCAVHASQHRSGPAAPHQQQHNPVCSLPTPAKPTSWHPVLWRHLKNLSPRSTGLSHKLRDRSITSQEAPHLRGGSCSPPSPPAPPPSPARLPPLLPPASAASGIPQRSAAQHGGFRPHVTTEPTKCGLSTLRWAVSVRRTLGFSYLL